MRFSTNQGSGDRSMILLAPVDACLEPFSGSVRSSSKLHAELLAEMQRLRGDIYLGDGAILPSELSNSGRHISPLDETSWHLLTMAGGSIQGCMRVLLHPNTIRCKQLNVSGAPLAFSSEWAAGFFSSINSELETARKANMAYVEIGGWALARELRGTAEALGAVLSTYALGQVLGGALGVTTATTRNGSANILRRLGGQPLMWDGACLPPYYDDKYRCGMEVLRFDSRNPCSRYADKVEALRETVARLPVIWPGEKPARQTAPGLLSSFIQSFFAPRAQVPACS